jgi:hypothetical protein
LGSLRRMAEDSILTLTGNERAPLFSLGKR